MRSRGLIFLAMLAFGCGEEKTQTPSKPEGGLTSGKATPAPNPESAARRQAREEMAKFKSFPFSFDLPDTKGRKVALRDYAGKVLIVDIWGTWCPPCREEIPDFIKLFKKYHESGLDIVGLNNEQVDAAEAIKNIDEFLKANPVPYKCLVSGDAVQNQVPDFQGFPTTLFLDRTGKVRMRLTGQQKLDDLEALVTELLEERPVGGR